MAVIEVRVTGHNVPPNTRWNYAFPGKRKFRFRNILESVVREEVSHANQERQPHRLSPVLTLQDIETARIEGKVIPGKFFKKPDISEEMAVEQAIKAFSNGNYLVLVDNIRVDNLDDEIDLESDSIITFIKLIPLTGG